MMESGEKELMKAFEDVTTNNVRANIEYSKQTRSLVRDLESKVNSLDGEVRTYQITIDLMKTQIALLQSKLYAGGTE